MQREKARRPFGVALRAIVVDALEAAAVRCIRLADTSSCSQIVDALEVVLFPHEYLALPSFLSAMSLLLLSLWLQPNLT